MKKEGRGRVIIDISERQKQLGLTDRKEARDAMHRENIAVSLAPTHTPLLSR